MSKSKKKRTKRYQGADAAVQGPVLHRYEAVERSRWGQWWFDHKARARIVGILAAIALVIVLIISGIVSLLH